jgi:hypothetical protein
VTLAESQWCHKEQWKRWCSPKDRGVVTDPVVGRTRTAMMFDEEEECHCGRENKGVGAELCSGEL